MWDCSQQRGWQPLWAHILEWTGPWLVPREFASFLLMYLSFFPCLSVTPSWSLSCVYLYVCTSVHISLFVSPSVTGFLCISGYVSLCIPLHPHPVSLCLSVYLSYVSLYEYIDGWLFLCLEVSFCEWVSEWVRLSGHVCVLDRVCKFVCECLQCTHFSGYRSLPSTYSWMISDILSAHNPVLQSILSSSHTLMGHPPNPTPPCLEGHIQILSITCKIF